LNVHIQTARAIHPDADSAIVTAYEHITHCDVMAKIGFCKWKLLTFVRTSFKKVIGALGGKYMLMTIKQPASEQQLNTRLSDLLIHCCP